MVLHVMKSKFGMAGTGIGEPRPELHVKEGRYIGLCGQGHLDKEWEGLHGKACPVLEEGGQQWS